MKIDVLIDWALARLSEPSTWRGAVLLLTSAGIVIDPQKVATYTALGLSIVGAINVIRREQKPATQDDLSKLGQATATAIQSGDTSQLTKTGTTQTK